MIRQHRRKLRIRGVADLTHIPRLLRGHANRDRDKMTESMSCRQPVVYLSCLGSVRRSRSLSRERAIGASLRPGAVESFLDSESSAFCAPSLRIGMQPTLRLLLVYRDVIDSFQEYRDQTGLDLIP